MRRVVYRDTGPSGRGLYGQRHLGRRLRADDWRADLGPCRSGGRYRPARHPDHGVRRESRERDRQRQHGCQRRLRHVPGLSAGQYFVTTRNSAGYVPEAYSDTVCLQCDPTETSPITVSIGETTPGIDFALAPGGRISGRVTDTEGGGIPGVQVTLYDGTGHNVAFGHTAGDGSYESIDGVPAGSYYANTMNWSGYLEELYSELSFVCPSCSVTSGTLIPVSIGSVTSEIDFTLEQGARISGRVTDENGDPVGGVSIDVLDSSGNSVSWASTDSAGAYLTYRGIPAGTYYVRTRNSRGFVDEIFDDQACLGGNCSLTGATGIAASGLRRAWRTSC